VTRIGEDRIANLEVGDIIANGHNFACHICPQALIFGLA